MKKILRRSFAYIVNGLAACGSDKNDEFAQSSEVIESSDKAQNSSDGASDEQSENENNESSQPTDKEAKNTMKVYNVCDYGAKHDGLDDSAYIQAAVDACFSAGGGTVYLPAGTFTICNTISKKAKVSIIGDGMWSTKLLWKGSNDSAMIDTSNEALWGTSIENLFFFSSGAEKVTGILGGSTLDKYNSAIGTFKNLVFSGIYCGISGDAEPQGVGIFDCLLENVFCSDCTYGLHLYGSGNTIIHPRIATCKAGLVLELSQRRIFRRSARYRRYLRLQRHRYTHTVEERYPPV